MRPQATNQWPSSIASILRSFSARFNRASDGFASAAPSKPRPFQGGNPNSTPLTRPQALFRAHRVQVHSGAGVERRLGCQKLRREDQPMMFPRGC
jgi:hypothetical protein